MRGVAWGKVDLYLRISCSYNACSSLCSTEASVIITGSKPRATTTFATSDARSTDSSHRMQELDRRRSLPGDPYGTGGKRQLKGIPEFQDAHWISNMTTIQLQTKVLPCFACFAVIEMPGTS